MRESTTDLGTGAMAELLAVVTRKGQVTIPAPVRKALDLKRGDTVVFTLPDSPTGQARLQRVTGKPLSVVEQTFGSLRSPRPALSPQEENRAFEEAVAEEVLRETNGGPPHQQP